MTTIHGRRPAAPPPGPHPPEQPEAGAESVATVLVAAAANLGIAVAKAVAGLLGGSGAMLSEAAHSMADTVTELLLLTALRRSRRPADEDYPLGHSQELYLWAMLASVATFVGGALFACWDGVHTLLSGRAPGAAGLSFVVLAVSFALEGMSLVKGLRQLRGEAAGAGRSVLSHLKRTHDTTVKAVVLEDSAALIGLLLAAGGLLAGVLTGSSAGDGIASLLIGVLLARVAWVLGRSNASLLIGRALPARTRAGIRAELLVIPHVETVTGLLTVVHGPADATVAAKVGFRDLATVAEVEAACEQAERRLRERFPSVRRVYLDPTPDHDRAEREGNGRGGARERYPAPGPL